MTNHTIDDCEIDRPGSDVEAPVEDWPAWVDEDHWEMGTGHPLSPRQAEIIGLIARSIHERGMSPTFREIGIATGINSPNGVMCHLKSLRKKGWITWNPRLSRSIQLTRGRVRPRPQGSGVIA